MYCELQIDQLPQRPSMIDLICGSKPMSSMRSACRDLPTCHR